MAQIVSQAPESPERKRPKELEVEAKKVAKGITLGNARVNKDDDVAKQELALEAAKTKASQASELEEIHEKEAKPKSDTTEAAQLDPAMPVRPQELEGPPVPPEFAAQAPQVAAPAATEQAGLSSQQALFELLKSQGPSAQQKELFKQMAEVQGQQAQRHQDRYAQQQALVEKELAKPVKKDYSSLIKALDAISGEDNFKYYTAPKTQDERDAQVAALRQKMDQNADKMSKSQLEQLSTMLSVQEDKSKEKKLGLLYAHAVRREKAAGTLKGKEDAARQAATHKKDQMGIKLVTKIKDDHAVKRSLQIANEAENVMGLVELGVTNSIAAASIPTFVARAAGEVGNLSEADKKPFGSDRAITNRLAQALETWTQGKITPENYQFLKEFSATLYQAKNYLGDKRKRELVQQFHAGQKTFGVDELNQMAGVTGKPIAPPAPIRKAITDAGGSVPSAAISKPAQVSEEDWVAATDEEKSALSEHFNK